MEFWSELITRTSWDVLLRLKKKEILQKLGPF